MRLQSQFVLSILLVLGSVLSASAQHADQVEGDWIGTLDLGGTELRIIFHISVSDDGELTTTMDSPDQGAKGIPTTKTTLKEGKLDIQAAMIGGAYTGVMDEEMIRGTWSQGGGSLPLTLERMTKPLTYNRPQEPVKPFPYREEIVRYTNEAGGFELEGTLTMPDSDGPFPAVVLISGSGPQDRDESLMGHKPFLVISDYLTRKGLAVLRYDDRGVGRSGGDFGTATTLDFATDVEAAVRFLRERQEIDAEAIGLIGHSEGGLIAPIVASNANNGIAFIVMLAGPGERGKEILLTQSTQMAHLQGMDNTSIERMNMVNERLYDTVIDIPEVEFVRPRLKDELRELRKEYTDTELIGLGLTEERDNQIIAQLGSPWMHQFLRLDPRTYLKQVRIPVLSLIGEKDTQVIAIHNSGAIERVLEVAGNNDYTVLTLPGLNHLFQQAETGLPNEYSKIEETFSEDVLEMISEWIKERV